MEKNKIDQELNSRSKFNEDLYAKIENINETNIDDILEDLRTGVSNGWVGEASEIADILLNSEYVLNNPNWLMNVHLERMKKFQYFKLYNLAQTTSKQILNLLDKYKAHIDINIYCKDKFIAIAQLGWIYENPELVKEVIKDSLKYVEDSSGDTKKYLSAFHLALKGRLEFMLDNFDKGHDYFNNAMIVIQSINSEVQTALTHIEVNYLESIVIYESKDKGFNYGLDLLERVKVSKLKSHLFLRLYKALITSNNQDEKRKKNHIFQMQMLILGMGLSRAREVYPQVTEAFNLIPEDNKVDFYELNFRLWLENNINELVWQKYEAFILKYYEHQGYRVIDLLKKHKAFDLIAIKDNPRHVKLIQAKFQKSKIYKVPDLLVYEDAISDIKENCNIHTFSEVRWHTLNKVSDDAFKKIKANSKSAIGGNIDVKIVSGNEEFVNFYLENADKMIDLFAFFKNLNDK